MSKMYATAAYRPSPPSIMQFIHKKTVMRDRTHAARESLNNHRRVLRAKSKNHPLVDRMLNSPTPEFDNALSQIPSQKDSKLPDIGADTVK